MTTNQNQDQDTPPELAPVLAELLELRPDLLDIAARVTFDLAQSFDLTQSEACELVAQGLARDVEHLATDRHSAQHFADTKFRSYERELRCSLSAQAQAIARGQRLDRHARKLARIYRRTRRALALVGLDFELLAAWHHRERFRDAGTERGRRANQGGARGR